MSVSDAQNATGKGVIKALETLLDERIATVNSVNLPKYRGPFEGQDVPFKGQSPFSVQAHSGI